MIPLLLTKKAEILPKYTAYKFDSDDCCYECANYTWDKKGLNPHYHKWAHRLAINYFHIPRNKFNKRMNAGLTRLAFSRKYREPYANNTKRIINNNF